MTTNGVVTTLYVFSANGDGAGPAGSIVQASDGNIYGTTRGGADLSGRGTIYRISTNGDFTSLYQFTGGADGSEPASGLILGADGSLYGTAYYGGDDEGDGTIFQCTTDGVFTLLYTFTDGGDGSGPSALVQGVDGSLYGTTEGDDGQGTIFQITTNGVFTTLYQFTGGADGGHPAAGLVPGVDGSLYGTTEVGGDEMAGGGTVFQISTNGIFNTLYLFTNGVDGGRPTSGTVRARTVFSTARFTLSITQQKLSQPMAMPQLVFLRRFAGANQIAQRFVGCVGNPHRGQFSGSVTTREFLGVPAVS